MCISTRAVKHVNASLTKCTMKTASSSSKKLNQIIMKCPYTHKIIIPIYAGMNCKSIWFQFIISIDVPHKVWTLYFCKEKLWVKTMISSNLIVIGPSGSIILRSIMTLFLELLLVNQDGKIILTNLLQ